MNQRTFISILSILCVSFAVIGCDEDGAVCGNGVLEKGEVCDLAAGLPKTCAEFDSSKTWSSGLPACANDCSAVTRGTCIEATQPTVGKCGDNVVDANEDCDGTAGVPATCSEYNSNLKWKEGGKPACSIDCKLQQGTCVVEEIGPYCGDGVQNNDEKCDKEDGVPATCAEFDSTKTWLSGGKPACAKTCDAFEIGTCVEATAPVEDPDDPNATEADVTSTTSCNTSTNDMLHEVCNGQTAHFCSAKGFVTDRDCSRLSTKEKTLTCQVSKEGNFADCVESCNPSEFLETSTCLGKYIAYNHCETAESGGSYQFTYTEENPCPVACENGRCVTSTGPKVGTECTAETFKAQCYNGNIYECIDKKIAKTDCTNGTYCAVQFGHSNPVCTKRCSLDDSSTYACQQINGKPALKNHICIMAADSKMYWFDETDECKTSCDSGVCDVKVPAKGDDCDPSKTDDLCIHNSVYYCNTETKKYDVMECGRGDFLGSQLCRFHSDSYASCVFPCSEGTEAIMQCGGSNEKGTAYTDNYLCEKATDGLFYTFNFQDSCPNGCVNGVCK